MKLTVFAVTYLLISAAVEPWVVGHQTSCAVAVSIAAVGALCDAINERELSRKTAASVILAAIAGFACFAFLRMMLDDNLQVAAAAGVLGIGGRKVVRAIAAKALQQLGLEVEDDETP